MNENSTAHEIELANRNVKLINERAELALYDKTFSGVMSMLDNALIALRIAMEELEKHGGTADER